MERTTRMKIILFWLPFLKWRGLLAIEAADQLIDIRGISDPLGQSFDHKGVLSWKSVFTFPNNFINFPHLAGAYDLSDTFPTLSSAVN